MLFKCELAESEPTYALMTSGQFKLRLVKADKVLPSSYPVFAWEVDSATPSEVITERIAKEHVRNSILGDVAPFMSPYSSSNTAYVIFLQDPDGTAFAIVGKNR